MEEELCEKMGGKKSQLSSTAEKKTRKNKIIKEKGKQSYLFRCGLDIDKCLEVVTVTTGLCAVS